MQSTKSLKLGILALLFVALIIFSGCVGTAPPINHSSTIISLTSNPPSPIEINQSTVITCLASDQDGDTLTYSWTKTGGTITGSGSTITWTAPSIAGTYTIICTVSDGRGGQDSESVNIEVFELDDETKITNTIHGLFQAINDKDWNTAKSYCVYGSEIYQGIVGAEQCYNLYGAYECDIPDEFIVNNINPIIINGDYAEAYAYLTTIWGSIEDSGENWLYLQKIDNDWRLYGAGGTTPLNNAPVITSTAVTSVTKDELYSYDVNATDSDGDTLVYSLTTKPSGMSINSSTGLITWTPTTSGSYNVTVKVSDGELFATQSFTIAVSESGIIPPSNIPSEAENFIGEWTAISPTYLSKVEIYSIGNYIYIHVWEEGNAIYGVQNFKISDLFNDDDVIKLHWESLPSWSCDQEMEVLNNGVLKVKATEYYFDYSFSWTDYFYNSEADNSFIPNISGMGLYQEDPEFVNLVYQLDSPEKICQYMEKYISYKILIGPHSPYQTYLSKEGDCGDYAAFANGIAHFHGYESYHVVIKWTNGIAHAIVVYDMGDHYTYSDPYLYFSQSFNGIEACVNHCSSSFGYILSDYMVLDWNYCHYKNITVR